MTPELPLVGERPLPKALTIQLCDEHEKELLTALALRGMERYVRLSTEQRQLLAELEQSDPVTVAYVQLATLAVQLFGTQGVEQHNGCPVCAFQSILSVIADSMALHFTKGH